MPAEPAFNERISGVVERVTFFSEESGFCVVRVKLPRRRELATVVGRAARISAGEYLQANGTWRHDPKHGTQFQAGELEVTPPSTREGMERYLGSGLIRGIGPALASRLVEAFDESVFDVIERHPERLREVHGVGEVRAQRLAAAWEEQKRVREIMVFLHSHGVGTSRAVRIFKTYGDDSVERIREDPYRLARDIRGIGFRTADKLARKLGIAQDAPSRVRAGIRFALSEALSDGHCGLPEGQLVARAEKLLQVSTPVVEQGLEQELAEQELIRELVGQQRCVFLPALHSAERGVARLLLRLSRGVPPWGAIDAGHAVPWVEQRLGLELAASQREALDTILCSKVVVLTGGPGVGKTTLVNALLQILGTRRVRTALAAPTGRAAKRLSEATGRDARTIHRLLDADPSRGGFGRDERDPIGCELLVLDETSMVDVPLLYALLRAVPRHAAVLLVGDVDQLPSVGPGQALADIIESGVLPVVRLREIFRQAAESRIVLGAHRINQGRMPELAPEPDADFFFIEAPEPENAVSLLLTVVRERIPARFGLDPLRDIQVLCPMHRGTLGARNLNVVLQQELNPGRPSTARVERYGQVFTRHDKVMQTENDYQKQVYNGDLGFVLAVDAEAHELCVDFDGRRVRYGFDELDQLVLAYATTIHKAQGSEYPAVVIPLSTQHYPMLRRNLVYTALTRGQKLVVMIGQRRALSIALRSARAERRWSKLMDWLTG